MEVFLCIYYIKNFQSKMNKERVANDEIEVSDEVNADCGISTEVFRICNFLP